MASYQLLPLTAGGDQSGPHNPHSRPMNRAAQCLALVLAATRTKRRAVLIGLILSTGLVLLISLGQSMDGVSRRGNSGSDNDANAAPDAPWTAETKAQDFKLQEATWTCTDDDLSRSEQESKSNRRSRQCVVENFCVDRKGGFIRKEGYFRKNVPKVNLMASDEESDQMWQPRMERLSWFGSKTIKAHFVNDTVFVHSFYSHFHFSHWLYNGMTPLYSTMKRFGHTRDSWTFRAARFWADPIDRQGTWEMDHFFQTGRELVLREEELSTSFQTLPPKDAPICFRRAVIGLGSQCALGYCEKNIPTEVYKAFRDEIADFYWKTPLTWQSHLKNAQYAIDHGLDHQEHETIGHKTKKRWLDDNENLEKTQALVRKSNITGVLERRQEKGAQDTTQLKCLEIARYYNFERAVPGHGQEQGEVTSRIGQRNPDYVDLESTYENTITAGGKRQLVVGILQRESSRRLLNGDELVEKLVQAGFRVKWMSFDHGCGLAETAYLLRDVNVLISPHGNALGASIFMPTHDPVSSIISVDTSRYTEDWFMSTSSALGQRFVQTWCGPTQYADEETKARCPYSKDSVGAAKLLENKPDVILGLPKEMIKSYDELKEMTDEQKQSVYDNQRAYVKSHPEAQKLALEELDILIGPEYPKALLEKYNTWVSWIYQAEYWKGTPRWIDVVRMVKLVEKLQTEKEQEMLAEENLKHTMALGTSQRSYGLYIDYVRKGKACGPTGCKDILDRNVAKSTGAFGTHSMDNVHLWGQPTSESETLRRGITPEMLAHGWTIDG
ncbi:hypothetical protein EMPS_08488 [Entomortierella parvispora]|uniref:Glycosyltransferase 61 catalytic domain-containing protein n=1 Tax=Entomortierella parvispora TaxID=205924 RepID=A0A9P3HG37_9FUNG|nr:hypothetical protein EMPS_08488 [Entomortierella parvispora]